MTDLLDLIKTYLPCEDDLTRDTLEEAFATILDKAEETYLI